MALITVSLTGLSADELTAIKKAYADEAGKAYGDVTESDIQDVVTTNIKQKIKCFQFLIFLKMKMVEILFLE